ncbi:MAG: HWE histidine kinase domain-containing protein [Devosia sp.]
MRVMEVSDFNAIAGCPWPDFWKDEGNEEARAAVEKAALGQSSRFLGKADTLRGNPKWWDVQVSPIFDEAGKPKAILSVSRDITEMKRAEQQAALLSQEMNHRMRNVLALVQAIIGQTLRDETPAATARTKILDRIAALGKAQDVLTQSKWAAASLAKIAEGVVGYHSELSRVTIAGPELNLDSQQALAMALALHELTVNAVKHGALFTGAGRVDIAWTIADYGALDFTWTEHGGPSPETQPSRQGFGSTLLTRAVPAYFAGTTGLDFRPGGLLFRLTGTTAPPAQ